MGFFGKKEGEPVDNFSVGWTEKGWLDRSEKMWYGFRVV
jgi:hypothetical protein